MFCSLISHHTGLKKAVQSYKIFFVLQNYSHYSHLQHFCVCATPAVKHSEAPSAHSSQYIYNHLIAKLFSVAEVFEFAVFAVVFVGGLPEWLRGVEQLEQNVLQQIVELRVYAIRVGVGVGDLLFVD